MLLNLTDTNIEGITVCEKFPCVDFEARIVEVIKDILNYANADFDEVFGGFYPRNNNNRLSEGWELCNENTELSHSSGFYVAFKRTNKSYKLRVFIGRGDDMDLANSGLYNFKKLLGRFISEGFELIEFE